MLLTAVIRIDYCALFRGRVCSLLLAILLLAATFHHSIAQDASLKFKHLGIADGLSQSSAYALFQDKKGLIWIGTTDGLSRYDGYAFRHFKYDQNNPHSIGSNELQALGEDSAGNLLVGTSVGLDLFDHRTERFQPIPVIGDEKAIRYVKCIFTDSRGTIWVGTGRGLAIYDQAKRVLLPVRPDTSKAARSTYFSIAEDAQKNLWFAAGRSVIKYDPVKKLSLPLPPALLNHPLYQKSGVFQIGLDADQQVWIGTEREGVLCLDQGTGVVYSLSGNGAGSISNDMIRGIGFYKDQTWIGSRNGLYIVNKDRQVIRHYQVNQYDPTALSGNSVLCFMHDRAGSIWVGTFAGGVSIVQPGNDNFSYINERVGKDAGLNYPVVSTILEGRDNKLWIATEGRGVNVFDRNTGQFTYLHVDPTSHHRVNQETIKAIQFDDKGNLWIGTLEGLFYYETGSRRIQRVFVHESEAKRLDEMIYSLGYREGILWIGTKGGLFKCLPDGTIIRYRHNNADSTSIVSENINALSLDRAGGVWIGTEMGLSWLPPGKEQFVNYLYEYASIFNKNAILCMYEDRHGNVWIGTRGGGLKVFNRQQNKFFTLDTEWGLADNIVHAVIEDRQGNVWVSFNQSIARITLSKPSPPYNKSDIQVTNYSVNNGLATNEFGPAAIRTASGQIMLGGMKGILAFQPEQMVINKVPPPVVITDLLIKNKPVAIGGEESPLHQSITYTDHITLTYDQAYFTLQFAALNYINPRTNQYAYKLEGLDQDTQWHAVGNQQSASYTNLSAGDYLFKVKAANNDGVWNDQFTTLRITVLPPFWKTWWAYLLYILIIAGLLYLFYFYSVKTTRLQHALALEELNRAKDQELMQRKLSFFTNISHEIKTPLTLVLAPLEKLIALVKGRDKETEQLELMQRNGQRLLRLTNQLLDFRKFEAGGMPLQVSEGDLVGFVEEIVQSFEGYAVQQHIALKLEVEARTVSAWFDADKLEKILYNLLSNAFKFTPGGGTIRVALSCTPEQAIIKVADDGAGIAPERLQSIFDPFHHYNDTGRRISGTGIGLTFTKGLVTLHHGTINVTSTQGSSERPGATCFTIMLPTGELAYSTAEKRAAVSLQPATILIEPARPMNGTVQEEPSEGEQKPVLLIVEDNAEVNNLLRDHFTGRFIIHTALSGEEGLAIATDILPDIIISDVMMPGMSGTELCGLLKKDIRSSHIPIILLTARNQLTHQIEGFETGADDYMTKPFSLSLLEVRVNNLLQSRRLLRERFSRGLNLQPSEVAITPADEVFLEKLMAFIEENLMEPNLQVEELGKVVNMSRTTLYRKLKALTGLSAIEFIRDVRLKRSAQLLQRQEYTVNEVAYMVGFSDVDYFRKCFKQQFGKTPKEFERGS
ncbi:two-component regulator propeller domain-containing protein [Paraflavitalea sp. CAU 1676]|uniref:two-component regulator propeller domain-containing protein n=1 Tax=Paraflavitalea sp. CAU 1676 TaxID=3032598 RepID=UPI0023DB1F02|nr:two-component regulator propeller domain-containing protein [Paraflavitalea sp. CAU 1676]MDF2188618.1 two-component regulator propeller domain-containing protein [Paraflavitalea sp. CAU 1676]